MIRQEWILWLLVAGSMFPLLRLASFLVHVVAYSSLKDLIVQVATVSLYALAFTVTSVSHIVLLRRFNALSEPS